MSDEEKDESTEETEENDRSGKTYKGEFEKARVSDTSDEDPRDIVRGDSNQDSEENSDQDSEDD